MLNLRLLFFVQRLLEEYPKCFIVGVDNVGSRQMQEIRIGMRGDAEILMGKNTMIRKAIRGHVQKNPALEKWVLTLFQFHSPRSMDNDRKMIYY